MTSPDTSQLIERNPEIMGGEPCIAGTRVPVRAIQSYRAFSIDHIMREYPGLTTEQIEAARDYVLPPRDLLADAIAFLRDNDRDDEADTLERLMREREEAVAGVLTEIRLAFLAGRHMARTNGKIDLDDAISYAGKRAKSLAFLSRLSDETKTDGRVG